MRPYSMDLRQRVLADCDAGVPTRDVAAKYRVSPAWVRRLKQRRRETGEVAPRPSRNRRRPVLELHLDRLRERIGAAPDANAFVVELDPTGSTEKYGTYWGGTGDDYGMGIGLDGSGDVIVAGYLTGTGKYPTTAGAYQTSGSGFLLKFHP